MNTFQRLNATIRRGSRIVDGVLLTLAVIALLLLTGHAHGAPLDWLNPSKAAAKLNAVENALFFAGGILAAAVVWFLLSKVFGFVGKHWKVIVAVSAIIGAIAALIL